MAREAVGRDEPAAATDGHQTDEDGKPAQRYDEDDWDLFEEQPEEQEPVEKVAANDEWAFEQADRQIRTLPQRMGQDRRTEGEVFDRQTLLTLHRMLRNGQLQSVDFPVSTGKEANVFRGTTPEGTLVAIKIFRTNTATFKHVLKYIQGDERFQGVSGEKRSLVYAWAQKEFRNLHRMLDEDIQVPEPYWVANNILVMEFLGDEHGSWPKLKELGRLGDLAQPFYEQVVQDYVAIVNDAGLVHADLSEFNILVQGLDGGEPIPRIIDVGQAVLRSHPMSGEFMVRDIKNAVRYFRKNGIKADPQDFLSKIKQVQK